MPYNVAKQQRGGVRECGEEHGQEGWCEEARLSLQVGEHAVEGHQKKWLGEERVEAGRRS